ncbi:MAG: hypothetical protein FJ301_03490 [Planctomycetes bacterium]|nr:hypothetical protein [Planctomycetota bacterium]
MIRFSVLGLLAALVAPVAAQDDVIHLVNGTSVTGVRVTGFDIRNIKYSRGGTNEQTSTDQVAMVELKKFAGTYARGLKDPGIMLTMAKEKLADKDLLLAQLGFVNAAAQFFDAGQPAEAVSALEELQKAIPEAGVLPEVFRQKFEYYMGLGGKGASSAAQVAKKYQADANANAWPVGLMLEADFFVTLADRKDPKSCQAQLKAIASKAGGTHPLIANRANVELAHSLRETKDSDGAQRIYEDISKKDGVDDSSRAGAYLGLGKILLEKSAAGDNESFKQAMLLFLRVRLETKDAWPSQQAEALYHATLAAEKWRGPEYGLVVLRCRRLLNDEFGSTEWAERAKR